MSSSRVKNARTREVNDYILIDIPLSMVYVS